MKKNILIIILIIIVIGLSGYIVYDKTLEHTNQNKIDENNNDTENNISWIDYLLEQEFVSASLSVCKIDDKVVYNKDTDFQPNPGVSREITQDELKKF